MNKSIIALIGVLCIGFIQAQMTTTSPYSALGYGESKFFSNAELEGMANTGTAYSSYNTLNFSNPASLSAVNFTTFNVGLSNRFSKYTSGDVSEKNSVTYLSSVSLGMPLLKNNRGGLAFGFQPYSSRGYSIKYQTQNNILQTINQFNGEGGINSIHLGMSYRLLNEEKSKLNLGATAHYLFGSSESSELTIVQNATYADATRKKIKQVSAIRTDLGLLYENKIDNRKSWTAGVTFTPETKLNADQEILRYAVRTNGLVEIESTRDTLVGYPRTLTQNIKLPAKSSIGFGYKDITKWGVQAQVDFENLSELNSEINQISFGKSSRYAVGGFYIPKFNSYRNYFARATYRFGASYKNTGYIIDNQDVKDYGITFGLKLPVGKDARSSVNIGFALGKYGTKDKKLISENYANIKIGLNFSDLWFRKKLYE